MLVTSRHFVKLFLIHDDALQPGLFQGILLRSWLPKQYDFRNFLMSEECLKLGQLVANMS